jgi:hypothetical protein
MCECVYVCMRTSAVVKLQEPRASCQFRTRATVPHTSVAFASSGVVSRSLLSPQFRAKGHHSTNISRIRKLRGCL